ncbi:MAG: 3-deoxy-8-phosphooctulonate synthase [Bacteroidetes bacterium]|nr:3-deoxy-8-phosphooctulonate synthase [Bacteroidota bacterium]
MNSVKIQNIIIGNGNPLAVIAGPCVVENREMIFRTAEKIKKVTEKLRVPLIFKASYKKANRTSVNGFTGIGMDEALQILAEAKKEFHFPLLTDVHSEKEISSAAEVADVLQIPAFLCRQTDLLLAAGNSGKAVNIKKGQFLAPEDMKHPIDKVASTGNKNILVTERGASFGYHNLVVDMRSFPIMKKFGWPVVMDATHSVQLPSSAEEKSGGEPEFIFPLARAAAAAGIDALFLETHPNPKAALSDAASQLPLEKFERLLVQVLAVDSARRETMENEL